MPGYYKTHEELVAKLQRAIKAGATTGDPSPELEPLAASEQLRTASAAFQRAVGRNAEGRPIPPPAGWFLPLH